MTDVQEGIRLQALAILLGMPMLPLMVKRKVLFDFLNIVKIKFTDEEMQEIEKTFRPNCCPLCGKPWGDEAIPQPSNTSYGQLRERKVLEK